MSQPHHWKENARIHKIYHFFRRQSLRVRLKIIFFVEALFGISSIGVAVFCPQIQQGPLIEQLHKTLFKRIFITIIMQFFHFVQY